MGEIAAGALTAHQIVRELPAVTPLDSEGGADRAHVGRRRVLTHRSTDMVMVDQSQVNAGAPGRSDHSLSAARHFGKHSVEEGAMDYPDPAGLKIAGQLRGARMNGLSDLPQTVWPVIDGVHAGGHREQYLRGADVRRRPFPADVLLTRLQRETEPRRAITILGHPDEPPRKGAFQASPHRDEPGVRSAVEQWYAEPLT